MLVENQKIIIKIINKKQLEHYITKGYICTLGETIIVDAKDLSFGSNKKVEVICDYCGKKYFMGFNIYNKLSNKGTINKCACQDCGMKKYKEIMMGKYGIDNPMKIEEIKDKSKNTLLKRYNVNNPMKIKSIQEKQRKKCFENNGFISPFELKETQEKAIKTRKEKYGCDYIFQSEEMLEKAHKTMQKKYGVISPFNSEKIIKKNQNIFKEKYGGISPLVNDKVLSKSSITRYLNNTCKTSKEQIKISKTFNGKLNYPVGRYNVDILLDDNIVLEYDGGAHNLDVKHKRYSKDEFEIKEENRAKYIIDRGFKFIRFKNNNDLSLSESYYKEVLKRCKDLLIDFNFVEYDFDKNIIKTLSL